MGAVCGKAGGFLLTCIGALVDLNSLPRTAIDCQLPFSLG